MTRAPGVSLLSFWAAVQDSLTHCSQELYKTYNYHKQQEEPNILSLYWKPLSQHFIVSRPSLTVKVRRVIWAHFCCTIHWPTASNNVQEEGGPGVSRTVDHAYFFLQISTIRLLLKFNLLDLDIIDAESSTSVHQCQIESQRHNFGWSIKE